MMKRAVEVAEIVFGGLHLAVDNAGLTDPEKHQSTICPSTIGKLFWQPIEGMFLSMTFELLAIVRSGDGAIPNLSSANSVVGLQGLPAGVRSDPQGNPP